MQEDCLRLEEHPGKCDFCERDLIATNIPFLCGTSTNQSLICAVCAELFIEQVYKANTQTLHDKAGDSTQSNLVWRDKKSQGIMIAAEYIRDHNTIDRFELDEKSFQTVKVVLNLISNDIQNMAWENLKEVWHTRAGS